MFATTVLWTKKSRLKRSKQRFKRSTKTRQKGRGVVEWERRSHSFVWCSHTFLH